MAREQGISEEKIEVVRSVVMAISACSIANQAGTDSALPEQQKRAFAGFYESTQQNKVLGERDTRLIQIAAALMNGCPT